MRQITFQSTCPARGTTKYGMDSATAFAISIHVPREGHDCSFSQLNRPPGNFNPRAPRGARLSMFSDKTTIPDFNPRAPRGARPRQGKKAQREQKKFQSTCPARGTTTIRMVNQIIDTKFQSTCPARGTTAHLSEQAVYKDISIHVPREGHDQISLLLLVMMLAFQSTCPARGTTV